MFQLRGIAASLTVKRLYYLLLNEAGFLVSSILKKPVGVALPWSVSIEPNNTCNLRCPECPTGAKSLSRPQGMMEPGLFENIISDLESSVICLNLYFQGEPMLHPQFFEMIKLARKKNIYVSTSTNGHYLDDAQARLLVESGLNHIIISVDGADQSAYASYRIGGNLEKVIQGIRNLVEWKKRLGSRKPFIELQFLVLGTNEHQLDQMKQLYRELGADKLTLKTAQIIHYQKGSPYIPANILFSRYQRKSDGTYAPKLKPVNRCHRMWRSAVITWEGVVVPCCFDKDAAHIMGDLRTSRFRDIWISERYQNFRSQILKNRRHVGICNNCTQGLRK